MRQRVATPGRSQTTGVAERANRLFLEGMRTFLSRVGLDKRWWSASMRCFCTAYNATRTGLDGTTPYERRQGYASGGNSIPFGSVVYYLPSTKTGTDGLEQFGPVTRRAILVGCLMKPGGLWSKDFLVVDLTSFLGGGGGGERTERTTLCVENGARCCAGRWCSTSRSDDVCRGPNRVPSSEC